MVWDRPIPARNRRIRTPDLCEPNGNALFCEMLRSAERPIPLERGLSSEYREQWRAWSAGSACRPAAHGNHENFSGPREPETGIGRRGRPASLQGGTPAGARHTAQRQPLHGTSASKSNIGCTVELLNRVRIRFRSAGLCSGCEALGDDDDLPPQEAACPAEALFRRSRSKRSSQRRKLQVQRFIPEQAIVPRAEQKRVKAVER
jgi:hypothetical protein